MADLFETLHNAANKRNRRENYWVGIICHHTGIGDRKYIEESTWEKLNKNITDFLLRKDNGYVSSHFIIHRDGKIFQLVDPELYEAFHAGVSEHWHPFKRAIVSDWNRYAIGIELIGDGNLHDYSDEQYESLSKLCKYLMDKYKDIHPLCITGHEVLCPRRKDDPGKKMNWRKLFKGIYS